VHSGDLHEPRADANLPEGSSDFTYGLERLAAAAPIGACLTTTRRAATLAAWDE